MQVNNIQGNSFYGVWGNTRMMKGKFVKYYYPFKNETKEEISRALAEGKKKAESISTPSLDWTPNVDEVEVIATKPLCFTKDDFEKFNRGFLSDTLAEMLTK